MYGHIDKNDGKDVEDQTGKARANSALKELAVHKVKSLFTEEHDGNGKYDKKRTALKFYVHLSLIVLFPAPLQSLQAEEFIQNYYTPYQQVLSRIHPG